MNKCLLHFFPLSWPGPGSTCLGGGRRAQRLERGRGSWLIQSLQKVSNSREQILRSFESRFEKWRYARKAFKSTKSGAFATKAAASLAASAAAFYRLSGAEKQRWSWSGPDGRRSRQSQGGICIVSGNSPRRTVHQQPISQSVRLTDLRDGGHVKAAGFARTWWTLLASLARTWSAGLEVRSECVESTPTHAPRWQWRSTAARIRCGWWPSSSLNMYSVCVHKSGRKARRRRACRKGAAVS